jgi:hypothetical protein
VSARLTVTGVRELQQQLQHLPDALKGNADDIVHGAANAGAVAARAAYSAHSKTGNLHDHVVVVPGATSRFGSKWLVKNTARHAEMFENGTEARHTGEGWNRGRMPAFNVFVPPMIRSRHSMWIALAQMVREATGWPVVGSVD